MLDLVADKYTHVLLPERLEYFLNKQTKAAKAFDDTPSKLREPQLALAVDCYLPPVVKGKRCHVHE